MIAEAVGKNVRAVLREEIRNMDTLVRHANQAYPRISPYRAAERATKLPVEPRHWDWINSAGNLVDRIRSRMTFYPFWDILSGSTKALKQTKLGDCGESSALTMCALLANGHTDGKIARLSFDAVATDLTTGKEVGRRLLDTTHEFVVRHISPNAQSARPETYGKDVIVMDSWTGFCGNLQEAFKHYYDTFWHGVREFVQPEHNVKITYRPNFIFVDSGGEANEKLVEFFKANFPELVLKK